MLYLVRFDIVLHYVKALRLFTIVLDNDAGAAHNLPCLALRVNLAKLRMTICIVKTRTRRLFI